MRKIASIITAAVLAACGQSYDPANNTAGKTDTEWEGERILWSDGSRSVGAYEMGYTDRLSVSYVNALVAEGELPTLAETTSEYYYTIGAYNWDRLGNLPFFISAERRPVKLADDGFVLRVHDVQLKGHQPATKYRLYLFKFHNISGVEGYTAVSMGLDEAIGGKVVTAADEVSYAPGMIAALQRGEDGPDRLGFAGTWKAVVVPDYRVPTRTEKAVGTDEVELGSIRLVAAPTTPPAPTTGLPADFLDVHRQVIGALASRNFEQANRFVHPDCGVFELYNPGAATGLVDHAAVSDALAGMRWGAFDGAEATCSAPVHAAELPHYSCEAGFTKQGCHAITLDGYQQLTRLQIDIDRWITGEHSSDAQMSKLSRCEDAVKISVGSAVGHDRFVLNYGQIDGKWYLIVIDEVTPCDA